MRVVSAFFLLVFATTGLCEDEVGFRIYAPGDTFTVERVAGKATTVEVTREWVEEEATANPEIRYYWRSSPTKVERVLPVKEGREANRQDERVGATRESRSLWESEVTRPRTAQKSTSSSNVSAPEVRTSRWVDGRYVNGTYVAGHMETKTASGVQKSSSTQIHHYYRPSTGEPWGDTNPNSPRNAETRAHYERQEARAQEKATSEYLYGKPLDRLPR